MKFFLMFVSIFCLYQTGANGFLLDTITGAIGSVIDGVTSTIDTITGVGQFLWDNALNPSLQVLQESRNE